MHDWLASRRLTVERFQRILTVTLQARKLRQRIASDRIDDYFASHRAEFDRLQFVEVRTAHAEAARQLASWPKRARSWARSTWLSRSRTGATSVAELRTRFAHEVAPGFASARCGQVIGPEWAAPDHVLSQVLTRQPARLDQRTRAAIEELVYREWLAAQRAATAVEWHWV